RHQPAQRHRGPQQEEHDEERGAEHDTRAGRDGSERLHLRKRVSASFAMSGVCLMMPASSNSSAASLLNAACSPEKNFWLASRSCQRRYFELASNASPLCFTSAPMISKLFFGSR